MFTWNFQYISKARLADTFSQLSLDLNKGDILIRIHTAIHPEEEAVELARYIKKLVPNAHIFGTSTSAVISWGRLVRNQCVISVTQAESGTFQTVLLPTFGKNGPIAPDGLCRQVRDELVTNDTKLLLTFLTGKYLDVYSFLDECNAAFPGVQMIGGVANVEEITSDRKSLSDGGFVFNELGWSDRGIMLAAIGGSHVDSLTSYATGVQALGTEMEVTDTFGPCVLSIDGKDAAKEYRIGIGDELQGRPELTNLFPYVYADASDIPVMMRFCKKTSLEKLYPMSEPENRALYEAFPDVDAYTEGEHLLVNHNARKGKKFRRAFIYDRKIISDNRTLFRRIENFEKAETIFGYSGNSRSMIYSNCVKWELSVYENSNICGCITDGEIAYVDGRNVFANCSFVVSVFGEKEYAQEYNPYAFSHTDSLAADNHELLGYLMDVESKFEKEQKSVAADSMKVFVRDCELKLLYSEHDDIPNAAGMYMDIKLHGYDRVCILNILDISSMKVVFSEQLIELTYKNYISKCVAFAREMHYHIYVLDKWQLAIAAPSYLVSLGDFTKAMDALHKELFKSSEEYISIVPIFCVMYDCTAENVNSSYNAARVEMLNKNIQFYVRDAGADQLDEESIRERYHMVNVINYAIANNKVIPYFQGIHDNRQKKIHHYEALMRLEDENGTMYYPNTFLNVARSFGLLYDSLSLIMIRKVFEEFKDSVDKSVSINLGIRDIKNREIVDYIYDSLSVFKHPENFIFEILENEDVGDYGVLVNFVDRIHKLGGQISIDDFGSGYSNLQHILSIQADYIKIDGSIIRNCCEDIESENLIALITGWKDLTTRDVKIIAEFVENESIQKKLTSYNVDYSQGYLFSKPMPISQIMG